MTAALLEENPKQPYAERIAKLLRKAEATDNAHEAEALTAKAVTLQIKYEIEQAMIDAARGVEVKDEIVEEQIRYMGIFQSALFDVGKAVAVNMGCKVLISKNTYSKPTYTTLHVVGFKSVIDHVRMIDASVQIQCTSALQTWWRSEDRSWMGKMQAFKAKREFIFGFAAGLHGKLAAAKREARQEAAREEAARTSTTEAAATAGMELVLKSRDEQVKDWYDTTYGKATRTVHRSYQSGGADARMAGTAAGRSANTGQTGVRGGRKQLGS